MSKRYRLNQALVDDLVAVLSAHPAGLRRWTLMRAMRAMSEHGGRDISPKFEDDVERAFRHHCEGDAVHLGQAEELEALFFRPKGSVGEVWAMLPPKAEASGQTRQENAVAELG